MTNSLDIFNKANEIVNTTGTREPKIIAEHLGIKVYYKNTFKDLLGMYAIEKDTRAIFMNQNLEEYMFKMVFAHEIGHDVLHQDIARNMIMQEYILFLMKDNTEYEANVFAAHLLLDTTDIFEQARQGVDVVSLAQLNCVNVNLVLIKLSEMVTLGYDLRVPLDVNRNFLKGIKA